MYIRCGTTFKREADKNYNNIMTENEDGGKYKSDIYNITDDDTRKMKESIYTLNRMQT